VKLALNYNELVTVPASLLKLPALTDLNLAHNKLTQLPAVSQWPSLAVLNVSYNKLTSLPRITFAPYLQSLNLSHNCLQSVPLCVTSFRALSNLNLSYNEKISAIPLEMGRLGKLTSLHLEGVSKCDCLPQNTPKDVKEYVSFLNSKRTNAKEVYSLKMLVLGDKKTGKSTLVRALKDQEFRDVYVDVTDWQYKVRLGKKTFHFSIWELGGKEEQRFLQHCFFSRNDLYILLFDLSKGIEGLSGMKKLLEAISSKNACSKAIIVGTHLDEIPTEKKHEVEHLLLQARALVNSYRKQLCRSSFAVNLKNDKENLVALKDEIYMIAEAYKREDGQPWMGQKVASSYHTLTRHVELMRKEAIKGKREPFMNWQDFKAMVRSLKLTDIFYNEDLIDASDFLDSVGALTFYNDPRHNLYHYCFLDPHWLCGVLSEVVSRCSRLCKNGIVLCSDLSLSFQDSRPECQLVHQCLVILARNFLVMPLSQYHILVPSKLQRNRPDHLAKLGEDDFINMCSRHVLFVPGVAVPSQFWATLLQWVLRYVPRLSTNLARFCDRNRTEPNEESDKREEKQENSSGEPHQKAADYQLEVWQCGLHYLDSEVMFRLEALDTLRPHRLEKSEGVLLVASPDNAGRQIFQTLLRSVVYTIKAWFPALDDGRLVTLEQKADCPQCLRLNNQKPFQFVIESLVRDLGLGKTSLLCGCPSGLAANHHVNISDVLSSFLNQDYHLQ